MGCYRRLHLMEREELSRRLAARQSLRATAPALPQAPSTLSRELTRHRASLVTYRAVPAHQRAQRWAHRPWKPRKLAVHAQLRRAVLTLLARRWSPEPMAHGLPQRYPEDPTMRISHEAISTYYVCAAPRSLQARAGSLSVAAPPFSTSPQGPILVAPRPGPCEHR